MKRPKLTLYLALLKGLVFLFQGCSFYARLGSVEQSLRLTGKTTASTTPEKTVVTGANGERGQHL